MTSINWKSIAWNSILILFGSLLYAIGVKAIAFPHEFVAGGLFGSAMFISYVTDGFEPNIIYLALNLPLFLAGFVFVGRRFFFYTLLAVAAVSIFFGMINFQLNISSDFYAALVAGLVSGLGVGLMLRSLGSGGGLDIVAVILNTRWGISYGRFFMMFHFVLFGLCFLYLDIDLCISSVVMAIVTGKVVDEVVSSFSKRKVVQILSEENKLIARSINTSLKRGATFIKAYGAYSNQSKDILMTVINSIQLKRLETLVFEIDPDALFIVEDSFTVLGNGFSKRKRY